MCLSKPRLSLSLEILVAFLHLGPLLTRVYNGCRITTTCNDNVKKCNAVTIHKLKAQFTLDFNFTSSAASEPKSLSKWVCSLCDHLGNALGQLFLVMLVNFFCKWNFFFFFKERKLSTSFTTATIYCHFCLELQSQCHQTRSNNDFADWWLALLFERRDLLY